MPSNTVAKKMFHEHLSKIVFYRDGHPLQEWIIKGSEHLLRYPAHAAFKCPCMGIITHGTKKVKGVSCVSIGASDAARVQALGWKVHHLATHYAYVLPPEVPA